MSLSEAQPEPEPKSLSPVGLTMPLSLKRLEEMSPEQQETDAETIMMKLWEEENIRKSYLNSGKVPLDQILHECTERCGQKNFIPFNLGSENHYFTGEMSERDIRVAAATVQWLATNVGRGLLHKFNQKLVEAHKAAQKKKVEQGGS